MGSLYMDDNTNNPDAPEGPEMIELEREEYETYAHAYMVKVPALVAALRKAERLAWEVGCETEDGVMTLCEDSRGDLYREISAALAQVTDKD